MNVREKSLDRLCSWAHGITEPQAWTFPMTDSIANFTVCFTHHDSISALQYVDKNLFSYVGIKNDWSEVNVLNFH
jgi:hypothetical protein